jgi:hypothetical protein
MTLSVISLPSLEIALMRTRPRSTAIIESPVSPFWTIVMPRRTRRSTDSLRMPSSSAGRIAWNSGLASSAVRFASRSSPATVCPRLPYPNRCSMRALPALRNTADVGA